MILWDANIQAALQKSLEKQRQLYEQKCQEMLKTQAETLRKEQLASTSGRTAPGTSRDGQNNLYPNLKATTTREQQPTVTSISSSYQRYNVAQNNVLTPNVPIAPSVNEPQRVIPSAPPMTLNQTNKVTRVQNASGLGSELNCPGCGNQFGLDIYQCVGGHSSCKDCKINSGICGVSNCRRTITTVRNRTLEMYMDNLMNATKKMTVKEHKPMVNQTYGQLNRLKCPNHQDGCSLHFTSNAMGSHLKECPFNEMACPLLALFGRCSWRGKFKQLDSHFADCHPEHRQAQVDTEMSIVNTTDYKKIFHLVLMGTYNFFIHLKIDSNAKMMYLAAQLVGTAVSASKWQYEFHIYNKAQPKRKFQYSDVCTSNAISIDDIYFKKQCAAIPIAYINTFLNHNCLNYKFFLKKQIRM
ncbi:PREDICTED: E3 ubiquitin-protein ligase sina-like isoform X2 [Papilio polytes]|uniref:E3 ubiquitin-protein ligase sina-like isoform X2 n=1 Tax=Papilio polytes TaxID=76194 RepID=UPI0006769C71|nr:PREDICTED: E3 ubiquitin-protein ligase sina-like isoform X2 [Papilio polytes]